MCELCLGIARGFSSGLCRMYCLGNVRVLRYLGYLLNCYSRVLRYLDYSLNY